MLLKKKACVVLIIATILFLMLASQTMQRRNFLLVQLTQPSSKETGIRIIEPPQNHEAVLPPSQQEADTKGEVEEAEEDKAAVGEEKQPVNESQQASRPCGCSESCVSDLDDSDWFSQRYDPDQEPVLRDTDTFDPNEIRWWLTLQSYNKDHTIEEKMAQLFKIISPPTVDFKPLPTVCRRCAVVGNSGNLRNSGHGKEINSHDFIIRLNKAKTLGFENDVGNRTTHHIMYPESARDLEPGVSLVLLAFKLRDLEWMASALSTGEVKTTYMRVKNRVAADKDKVLVVNPKFFQYVHNHWTDHHGRYPSTGMMAIIFSLHICDQVSVFGYGADHRGYWHHYWENNGNAGAFRKTGVHNADFEHEVIHQLAKEGKITLNL